MPLYEGLNLGSDKHSVVIEIGHVFTRCGFVNEYAPRAIISSKVYIDPLKKELSLHDIKDRKILFEALKNFLECIYFRYLAVNPKDRRVLVVESLFWPLRFREALAQVFFKRLDVPSILFVPQHLMSLSTLAISSALILDVGYQETIAYPVHEGVTVLSAIQMASLGSKVIHERINHELVERNAVVRQDGQETQFTDILNDKALEDIKLRSCFVAPYERGTLLAQIKANVPEEQRIECDIKSPPKDFAYHLDNERILIVPGALRESAAEVLFEMYGEEHTVATLVLDAIVNCPIDVRKTAASNILIIGGTSMLPGFKHRLLKELKHLSKSPRYLGKVHTEIFKFHEPPCKENYVSWLGASIYGTSEVVQQKSLTREQFVRTGKIPKDCFEWLPEAS